MLIVINLSVTLVTLVTLVTTVCANMPGSGILSITDKVIKAVCGFPWLAYRQYSTVQYICTV
jgi:hypothetical protein